MSGLVRVTCALAAVLGPRRSLVVLLLSVAGAPPALGKEADSVAGGLPAGTEVFEQVDLPEPFSAIDCTEDGKTLLATLVGEGGLIAWDVESGRRTKSLDTPHVSATLFRGGKLFVASSTDRSVRAYAPDQGWKQVAEYRFGDQQPKVLAAPRGAHFDGTIIVGTAAPKVFRLDTSTGKVTRLYDRGELASIQVDVEGVRLVEQNSIERGSNRAPQLFDYVQYVKGDAPAAGNRQDIRLVGVLRQAHPGALWFTDDAVFAGDPMVDLLPHPQPDWGAIVPDRSKPMFYVLASERVRGFTADLMPAELAARPAKFPATIVGQSTGALLSPGPHVATTIGDRLYVFVKGYDRRLYRYATEAFVGPAGGIAKAGEAPVTGGLPPEVLVGQSLIFPLAASGKTSTGRTFALVKGPPGATVTAAGVLTWQPEGADLGEADFKIRAETDGRTEFLRLRTKVVDTRTAPATARGVLEPVRPGRHTLLKGSHWLAPSAGGGEVLLLQGSILRVLDGDGLNVRRAVELPGRYHKVHERESYFIGVSDKAVEMIDKTTLQVTRSIKLSTPTVHDVGFDPVLPRTYVSMGVNPDVPGGGDGLIHVVYEATGLLEPIPGAYAASITVDPAGRQVYAAVPRQPIAADWSLPASARVPKNMGSALVAYGVVAGELRPVSARFGSPFINFQTRPRAVVSPDGMLVASLPGTALPDQRARRLVASPAGDLSEGRVGFTIDEHHAPDLSFHPNLPLVAASSGRVVNLYDLNSGRMRDALAEEPGAEEWVTGVCFAPGGRHLLVTLDQQHSPGSRAVRSLALRLSLDERTALAVAARRPTPARLPAVPPPLRSAVAAAPVRAEEIDAIRPGADEPLKSSEIARRDGAAVALLTSTEGSGTGFFVGRGGYLITCAHVLPEAGELKVTLPATRPADGREPAAAATYVARVVRADRQRDLALVKIEPAAEDRFTVLHLPPDDVVELGEEVTVLGHPGLGAEVLEFTLTTGIVSNAERRIEGISYVQTDAAVNPGSSGGPMWDRRGRVIGVVAAKVVALEGTGFAVAVKELRSFLQECTKAADDAK